jgi:drug/metabolite transporter (DMT)-like permease
MKLLNDLEQHKLTLGVTVALAEIFLMVGISVLVKLISCELSTVTVLLFRYSCCLPLLVAVAMWQRGRQALVVTQHRVLIFRIAAGLGSLSCFYAALAVMSLATVTALLQMITLFITFLAPFMLGEVIGRRRWIAVLVGFGGAIILLNPGFSEWSFWGVVFGLGAPFFGAIMMIMLRKLGKSDNPASTAIWYNCTGACVFATIFFWRDDVLPNAGIDVVILVLIGVLSSFQQYFIAFSHKLAPASFLAPFRYMSVPVGIVAGIVFFQEQLTPVVIGGSAIIVLSSGFILRRDNARANTD